MTNVTYINKKAVVIGLGKTGISCVRYLKAKQCQVVVMDSRDAPASLSLFRQAFPDVEIHLGEFQYNVITSCDLLVLSPGVDPRHPAIKKAIESDIEVLGDVELFAKEVDKPIIAITGSNGKSTVTELVGHLARHAGINVVVGGNLGEPVLNLIDNNIDLYVLELSSFQLETVSNLNAIGAVVLNISEDHMDRYDSLVDYTNAKQRIYRNTKVSLLNLDDPIVANMKVPGTVKTFTLSGLPGKQQYGLIESDGKTYLAYEDRLLLNVDKLLIYGRHNLSNALAALALGNVAGLQMNKMLEALTTFPGLEHRMQWIGEHRGVHYINDSKATNVGATVAAVHSVDRKIVLIAGGVGKDQNFYPLKQALSKRTKAVLLMGRDAVLIADVLAQICDIHFVGSMEEAVKKACNIATENDMVLLSPACASFDMYNGFEERGNDFCQCVYDTMKEAV